MATSHRRLRRDGGKGDAMGIRTEYRLRRTHVLSVLALGTLSWSLLSTQGTGDDQTQIPSSQELQGILPGSVPAGLGFDDFEALGGKWKDWAGETAQLVADFYESDDPEIAGRRETLNKMKVKLGTMEKALNDPAYRALHGPLSDLNSRLSRRVDVAEAVLNSLEQNVAEVSQQRLASSLPKLASTTRSLKSYLGQVPKGELWVPYLRLDEVGPAADAKDTGDEAKALYFTVAEKLNNRTQLDEQQRDFLSRAAFLNFEDALQSVVQAAQSLDEEAYLANLRTLSGELLTALEKYEEEPIDENSAAVRSAYDAVRRFAVDGGDAITPALRAHYLNYNLRFVAGEGLLKRIIKENRLERGFVNDQALGARISGTQWTNSSVDIDLQPSGDGARFDLVLTGTINANTRGDAGSAVIFTSGNHGFYGRKGVLFDGQRFSTFPSQVNVNANNQTTGATTGFSWIPLIGNIANNIAYNEAQSRRGEANAYTRNKIYAEVAPRFDSEVNSRMQQAQSKLEADLYGPLREQGLFPDVYQYSSSDIDVTMRGASWKRARSPAIPHSPRSPYRLMAPSSTSTKAC